MSALTVTATSDSCVLLHYTRQSLKWLVLLNLYQSTILEKKQNPPPSPKKPLKMNKKSRNTSGVVKRAKKLSGSSIR